MITYRTNASTTTFGRTGNCFYNSKASGTGSFAQGRDFSEYISFANFHFAKPSPSGNTPLPMKSDVQFYPCYAYDSFLRVPGDIVKDFSLDRLNTSKVLAFGDHNCYHYKINAELRNPNNPGYYTLPNDLNTSGNSWRTGFVETVNGPLVLPSEGSKVFFPVNRNNTVVYHMHYTLGKDENPSPLWLAPSMIRKDLFIDLYWILQTSVINKSTINETWTWRVACSAHGNFFCTGGGTYDNTQAEFWSTNQVQGYLSRAEVLTNPGNIHKDLLQLVYGDVGLPMSLGYYSWTTPSGVAKTTGTISAKNNFLLGANWLLTPDAIWTEARTRNATRISQYFVTQYKPTSSLHVYQPTVHTDGITPFQANAAIRKLFAKYARYWDTCPEPTHNELGDVALLAAQSAQAVDINSIAYLRDIPGYIKLLKDVITVLKTGISPSSALSQVFNPKTWASLYLFKKWGVDLTVNDTKELIAAVGNNIQRARQTLLHDYRSCNARKFVTLKTTNGIPVSRIICYKLYYQPYDKGLLGALKRVQDWDIYPTLENMWDLIPFSFVVDWSVNVQQLLNEIDTVNYYQYLGIKSTVYSVKDTCTLPDITISDAQVVVHGITLCRYKRQVFSSPFLPSFRLEQSSGPFNHEIEAGAIIAQRF